MIAILTRQDMRLEGRRLLDEDKLDQVTLEHFDTIGQEMDAIIFVGNGSVKYLQCNERYQGRISGYGLFSHRMSVIIREVAGE